MIVSPERRSVTAMIRCGPGPPGHIECNGAGPLCHLLAPGLRMGLEPDIGPQLTQSVHRVGGESAEDVSKVGEGVDVVMLTGAGQGVQDGRRSAAPVTPEEGPVAPADCLGTEHSLGEVVVDAQVPMLRVP